MLRGAESASATSPTVSGSSDGLVLGIGGLNDRNDRLARRTILAVRSGVTRLTHRTVLTVDRNHLGMRNGSKPSQEDEEQAGQES
jgi:hypothetical protein